MVTTAEGPAAEVAAEYGAFARQEAHGRSAAYESAAVLIRDGRTPLAHTDPHGTWLRWLG